jgi:hypothetical protein
MRSVAGKYQRTTIQKLSEDVLLKIFDFYRLDAIEHSLRCLWKWHHLAHVYRTWRHVISMSLRNLYLRILCEYRTYREYFGYLANIAPSRKVIYKSGIKTPTEKHYGCNPSPRWPFGDSPYDKLDDWTNLEMMQKPCQNWSPSVFESKTRMLWDHHG